MGGNQTSVTEFLLVGFPLSPRMKVLLFGLFSLLYAFTLLGNGVILGLISLDSRLHTPMYFFLSQLATVDISYACNTVPQMLINLLSPAQPISFAGCMTQTFLFLTFALTECFLLVMMSYDRHVAICLPLRYSTIMSWRVCVTLAGASWILGVLLAVVGIVLLLPLPFCGPQKVNHFFCEILAVLKLACADTHLNKVMIVAAGVLALVGPLLVIVVSYGHILRAVLRIQSAEGRQKAFSTCSSHLCVVGLYYGTAIIMYVGPQRGDSQEQRKYLLLFHSLFNPMLNPLIYSLRNREVHAALKRWLEKGRPSPHEVNHFFCEILSVLRLACVASGFKQLVTFAASVFVLVGPLFLVMVSYTRIHFAILKIQSPGQTQAPARRGSFERTDRLMLQLSPPPGGAQNPLEQLSVVSRGFDGNASCQHWEDVVTTGNPGMSMGGNQTWIPEVTLLGFQVEPALEFVLFGLFALCYVLTLLGNGIILGLVCLDCRLHSPMYFFLSHLAIIDMSYASNNVPKMLANLVSRNRTISFVPCLMQTYLFLAFAHAECLILVVMSYDRYVAICHPLQYTVIMSWRVCTGLAVTSWVFSFLLALVHVVLILRLPFCGPHEVNHFFCEILSVLRLACADTRLNQLVIFAACVFILVGPLCLVLVSYTRILFAVLRIQSGEGRRKAFSTCSSHLGVVGLFFGSAIVMYMAPKSSHPEEQQKVLSLFYSLCNPMLNPLIYSLRNAEVKGALRRVLRKERPT
ncbi:uncharacterized protein AAES06_001391 [Glossophaga mutica]